MSAKGGSSPESGEEELSLGEERVGAEVTGRGGEESGTGLTWSLREGGISERSEAVQEAVSETVSTVLLCELSSLLSEVAVSSRGRDSLRVKLIEGTGGRDSVHLCPGAVERASSRSRSLPSLSEPPASAASLSKESWRDLDGVRVRGSSLEKKRS